MIVSIRRVLCPTDFSDPAREAQRYAMVLAEQFGAQLHLLHVVPPPMPSPHPATPWVTVENEMSLRIQIAEQHLADELDSQWFKAHGAVSSTVMGFAVPEILNYAKVQEIDLIVVGTHGRTGVSHLMLGSIAEKLVRASTCPVLTVHPRGRQFVVDDASQCASLSQT